MSEELKVVSIDELKKYSGGQIVELPDFGPGQPFVARLKRPSILAMAKKGQIPNKLLKSANEVFEAGIKSSFDVSNENALNEVFDILDTFCGAAFVEPTYNELIDSGIELTDEQLLAVFNYIQAGAKSLENFRK